ncbi:MAG: hypothetical protein D3906_01870 [Candidatus Electrothrix sp. AUS1_2]|nr:hypothetical protein [Candidatus Electrothrix sp. AUS1_2]
MKKIQGVFRTVISAAIMAVLLFSSTDASAFSDLDTRFSVQLSDRERILQCDFLIITQEHITCTNKENPERVSLALMTRLNVFYMGKEYNLPQVGTKDIESINAMSMRKEQAVLARRTGRINIIGSLEPEGRSEMFPFFGGAATSSFLILLFLLYTGKFGKTKRRGRGKSDAVIFSCSFCEKSLRVVFPFNSLKFSCSNCHNKYEIRTLNEKNRVYLFLPETKNVGSSRTAQSRRSPLPEKVRNAFFLFGLNEDATFDEAKTAYRRSMAEYHPDKVSHLGEELQRIAEEKTKAYNMAFDEVKKYFRRNA